MRRRAAILVAALAVGLSACASIPTSGPVNEGDGQVASADPFVPFAEGPGVDDSPTEIVNGFIKASSAGFASNFTVARQYLAPNAATEWDPGARVLVFDSGALTPTYDEPEGTVSYVVPVLATIDESGRLVEAADGTSEPLAFTVALSGAGQWRITGLDDGTIIAAANFNRLFLPVKLLFASSDRTTQVPEVRWLAANKAPSYAARELVEGPSPWLANAVATGFPPGSQLDVEAVVVTDGTAVVLLNASAGGSPADRSLASEQLSLTLAQLPGVTSAEVTVAGIAIGGDGSASLERAPVPSAEAAAFVDGRLGLWDGADLWMVPTSVGGLPAGARNVSQSFDDARVAFLAGKGSLVVSNALANGVDGLVPADSSQPTPGQVMRTRTILKGADLVGPRFDRHGWLWTGERANDGTLAAVDPQGTIATLDAPWLSRSSVQAISMARDGTRLVVLSRTGSRQSIHVVSVARGADGTPTAVGEPLEIGADIGPSIDVAWVDEVTVAVLGEPGGEVPNPMWLVTVGGLTTPTTSVTGAVGITSRNGERTLTSITREGTVYERAGSVWSQLVTGVQDLEYSG